MSRSAGHAATTEVIRLVRIWARRADAGLARGAARNAALCVESQRSRDLDNARTMRDLQLIPVVEDELGIEQRSARRA